MVSKGTVIYVRYDSPSAPRCRRPSGPVRVWRLGEGRSPSSPTPPCSTLQYRPPATVQYSTMPRVLYTTFHYPTVPPPPPFPKHMPTAPRRGRTTVRIHAIPQRTEKVLRGTRAAPPCRRWPRPMAPCAIHYGRPVHRMDGNTWRTHGSPPPPYPCNIPYSTPTPRPPSPVPLFLVPLPSQRDIQRARDNTRGRPCFPHCARDGDAIPPRSATRRHAHGMPCIPRPFGPTHTTYNCTVPMVQYHAVRYNTVVLYCTITVLLYVLYLVYRTIGTVCTPVQDRTALLHPVSPGYRTNDTGLGWAGLHGTHPSIPVLRPCPSTAAFLLYGTLATVQYQR